MAWLTQGNERYLADLVANGSLTRLECDHLPLFSRHKMESEALKAITISRDDERAIAQEKAKQQAAAANS